MSQSATAAPDFEAHPLVDDVNAQHQAHLSPIEKVCKRIADLTGAPLALLLAILVQFGWVAVGMITRWDPYPFLFLLTCSNILQLILIFVIAVAQKQSSQHDELRAEADHDSISRLLYHDQAQEALLLRISEHLGIDASDLKQTMHLLATQG
ncbi:MAG: DUF1003 domain-containing protein [Candidatus Eremiobacteraeota bacterium]|nr:DUF1003 domain-containing protein [Candidatus Eremiobacteraeota bacterium]MBV9277488.1 DUF1003 domain-containing protein [Candidatus Eremiobacteraeota bacterium]